MDPRLIASVASRRRGSLSARLVTQPNTVALLGDSITAKNGTAPLPTDPLPVDGIRSLNADGYATWANTMLGKRCEIIFYGGIAANTLVQMAARVSDATASGAAQLWVMGGINDCIQGHTLQQMQDSVVTISNAASAKAMLVVWLAVTPADVPGILTRDQDNQRLAFNQWLAAFCQETGYYFVDTSAFLADPATGDPYADTYTDDPALHPGMPAAFRMGYALAQVLDPILPPTVRLIESNQDGTTTDNPTGGLSLLANGRFTGTGGFAGSDVSGPVADDWAVVWGGSGAPGAAVCTLPNNASGFPGKMQQVEITGAPDDDGDVLILKNLTSGWSIGDTLKSQIYYELDQVGDLQYVQLEATALNVSNVVLASSYDGFGAALHQSLTPAISHHGVLLTPELVVPTNTVTVRFMVSWRTGGTVGKLRVDRAALLQIAA